MALDDDFKTLMLADTVLMITLPGKAWSSSDLKTVDGMSPEATPLAFDNSGKLKPSALALMGAEVPDGWMNDVGAQLLSTIQVVRITIYQLTGWTAIDSALARLYALFHGYDFADGRQVEFVNRIPRLPREAGALKNSSAGRIDFAVYTVKGS